MTREGHGDTLLQLVLSFGLVGPRNGTQVASLGCKWFTQQAILLILFFVFETSFLLSCAGKRSACSVDEVTDFPSLLRGWWRPGF